VNSPPLCLCCEEKKGHDYICDGLSISVVDYRGYADKTLVSFTNLTSHPSHCNTDSLEFVFLRSRTSWSVRVRHRAATLAQTINIPQDKGCPHKRTKSAAVQAAQTHPSKHHSKQHEPYCVSADAIAHIHCLNVQTCTRYFCHSTHKGRSRSLPTFTALATTLSASVFHTLETPTPPYQHDIHGALCVRRDIHPYLGPRAYVRPQH
jgi:hypothetical protein